MAASMKLLVLRFASIGDIVLTTPVVRCLKQQLSGAEVHYCTDKEYQALVDYSPYIDKRHYLSGNVYQLIRQLRAEQFDYVIDLQNNWLSSLIKTALGVRSYSVEK